MGKLLHTVQCPQGSGLATAFNDAQGDRTFKVAKGNVVQEYVFTPDFKGFLLEEVKQSFSDTVTALTTVPGIDSDIVLGISNGTLYDLTYSTSPLVNLGDGYVGRATALGFGFYHLISFQNDGRLYIAIIMADAKVYVCPYVHQETNIVSIGSLGCALVKQVAQLKCKDNTFAVLTSGYDLSYSLRYYRFNEGLNPVAVCLFDPFVEAPSLIIPMAYGGVMVLSNFRIYLFPGWKQTCSISDDFVDSETIPVSLARNVITIDIKLLPYLNSLFTAFAKIDDERYLVSTDTGLTAVIYIQLSVVNTTVSLEAFSIVDLGKSTIAESLCHIQDNVFFAASRYSRSILFRILPNEPHIQILSFFPSSPPVIDLDYSFNTDSLRFLPDIFVCQGGYHSGELRKVPYLKWESTQLSSIQLDIFHDIVRILPPNLTGYHSSMLLAYIAVKLGPKFCEFYEINDSLGSKKLGSFEKKDFDFPVDNTNFVSLMINEAAFERYEGEISGRDLIAQLDVTGKVKFAKSTVNNTRVLVKEGQFVCHSGNGRFLAPLEAPEHMVCSIDVLFNGPHLYGLVAFTNGLIQCFNVYKTKIHQVWALTCGSKREGLKDARFCLNNNRRMLIVALDGLGNVHQYLLEAETILASTVWICKVSPPRLMDSDGLLVILFDAHKVVGMVAKGGHFLELCDFFYSPKQITGCNVLLLYHYMVGVHLNDGSYITVSHRDNQDSIDAHFSDRLWTKVLSIKGTPYLVCIKTDVRPNRGHQKYSTLNLIDGRSMKLLHALDTDLQQYTDLCLLPEDETIGIPSGLFVAVRNNGQWSKRFPIFTIQNGKIKELPDVKTELNPSKVLTFSAISFHNKELHAVGNEHVILSLLPTQDGYIWAPRVDPSEHPTGTFQHAISVSHLDQGKSIILDSFHGVFTRVDLLRPIPFKRSYKLDARPTAICVVPRQNKQEQFVIIGDSLGNIYYGENVLGVSSQINVIKYVEEDGSVLIGTLDGGIYKLTCKEEKRGLELLSFHISAKTTIPYFSHIVSAPEESRVYLADIVSDVIRQANGTELLIILDAWRSSSDKGILKRMPVLDPKDNAMAEIIDDI